MTSQFIGRRIPLVMALALGTVAASSVGAASFVQDAPSAAQTPPPTSQQDITIQLPPPTSLTEALLLEVETLQMELTQTRTALAQARLDADAAQRELAELRQFVLDRDRFGNDFAQYKAVKDAAEREARERAAEESRTQRSTGRDERDARRAAARAQAAARNAESDRLARYRRMGFSSLGLDVFGGRMAFFYDTKTEGGTGPLVNRDSLIGTFLQPGIPSTTVIDYSQMTISGSVLNASDIVRNIGVAITFFDETGNQVGHETVEIKNARPDVPYPFTSKINMALNRAFASSSTYVLYADPAEE